jgi:hypothetical protein
MALGGTMKHRNTAYLSLSLLLTACGQIEPTTAPEAKFASAAAEVDLPEFEPNWSHASASPMGNVPVWTGVRNTESWTATVHKTVAARIEELEKAQDKEEFCPGYSKAGAMEKEACWVRLVSAMVQFESRFKPDTVFLEPDGNKSIGLLSLSPGECANAPSEAELKVPEKNLSCGTALMAKLIARQGYINGPKGQRGAAAYWSVLREPYRAHGYELGKQDEIIELTKEYKTKLAR